MARRYINTAQFNPYSFQEIWEPALAATQAHQQQMSAMAELNAKSNLISQYIDPEKDPEEYAAWQRYNTGIQQASQDLMNRGLSTAAYNNVYGLTVEYTKSIQPIQNEIENKEKFSSALNEARIKNPNLFFVKDGNDYSLRDYKFGMPNIESIDGTVLMAQAEALAKSSTADLIKVLPKETYDRFNDIVYKQKGMTLETALESMQTPQSRLNYIKQLVLQGAGADRLLQNNKQNDYMRLDQMITQGIVSGAVGERTADLIDSGYEKDRRYQLDVAKFAWQKQKEMAELDLKQKATEQAAGSVDAKLKNMLITRSVPDGANGFVKRNIFTPHGTETKQWGQTLSGLLRATETDAKANKKGRILLFDENGKEVNAKKIRKDLDKGTQFTLSSDFDRNGHIAFRLELDGQTYFIPPARFGLPHETIQVMEKFAATPICKTYQRAPEQLSPDERAALANYLDEFTIMPIRTMYDLGVNSGVNYSKQFEDK